MHTVASRQATKERTVDDRERAPDGHNHVGNGALARAAARNGSNGADPVLEEMVSQWRRRVAGPQPEDDSGTDEPTIARGRAEVPGPPFANDPADVNRAPFIPQQPQARHEESPREESAHHFPSAPDDDDDDRPEPPPRRTDRQVHDERIRYQRPFRFRQRQDDGPQHGHAEAQFGPAESGPPEYRPPEQPRQGWQPEHRNTGPEFSQHVPGSAPRSPAPYGAPDAPVPPVPPVASAPPFSVTPDPAPTFGSPTPPAPQPSPGATPPFGSAAPSQPSGAAPSFGSPDPAPPFGSAAPPQPSPGATPPFGSAAPPQPLGAAPPFGAPAPPQPSGAAAPFGTPGPPQPMGAAPGAAPPFGTPNPVPPFGATPDFAPPVSGQPAGPPTPHAGTTPPAPPRVPFAAPPLDPAAQYPTPVDPYTPAGHFPPPVDPYVPQQPAAQYPAPADPYAPPQQFPPTPADPNTAFGNHADPTTAYRAAPNTPTFGGPVQPFQQPVTGFGGPGQPYQQPSADPTTAFGGLAEQRPPWQSAEPPPPYRAMPGEPTTAFGAGEASYRAAPGEPTTAFGAGETSYRAAPAEPTTAFGNAADPSTSRRAAPESDNQATPPPTSAEQPTQFRPMHRNSGSHGATIEPPRFGRSSRSVRPTSSPPARPISSPPSASTRYDEPEPQQTAPDPEPQDRVTQETPAEDQPIVPAPLIPQPFVPAPLIPPVSPAPDPRWASGPWSDEAWSAGTSPSVGWQATPEPPPPPPIPSAGAFDNPQLADLPQRVPAEPDVPPVPGDDGFEAPAEAPADLSRIRDFLREEEVSEERRDGFDFPAVIDAVQGVVGVREAEIVNLDGRHTLRLDLSDDADPAEVSRAVARLLKEQMGVSAEPTRPPAAEEVDPMPAENVGEAIEEVAAIGSQPEMTHTEPPELAESDGMVEPPELTPTSEPVPARLADLPRVGEPPTSSDSVRVASVPTRRGLPAPRVGSRPGGSRPADSRPLRTRLADIEPELSFEEWLEAIRPGQASPSQHVEAAEQPQPEADEHQSLVGMPMAPVFSDPTANDDEADDETEDTPEPGAQAPELGLPTAPAFQFAGSGGRVRLEQVEVNSHGLDAEVQVRLSAGGTGAVGHEIGPAVDGYILRLCATATAGALDALLTDPDSGTRVGRCYIEHATVVPLGNCEIALVVMLIVSGGFAEQLSGSAIVAGDVRQAVVRATLAAANRRLDALLP